MKPQSIYEVLPGSYCESVAHQYFLDIQMAAFMQYTTALTMKGYEISAGYYNLFNLNVVKATTAYVVNCGCPTGFMRSNRGKLSNLLEQLPQNETSLEQNRRKVMRMENEVMRIKINLIFEIKNFEPNQIAMNILEKQTVEDIELIVDIKKGLIKTELEIHDDAEVCVSKELNTVKTCAAFTPSSLLTSCGPLNPLSNGQFLCLENKNFCHIVCDEGFSLDSEKDRIFQNRIKCLDKTWTPGSTTIYCKPDATCESLRSGIIANKWRNNVNGMSDDDVRNTVITELFKLGKTGLQSKSDNDLNLMICGWHRLNKGKLLTGGQFLISSSGQYSFNVQIDGNLVVYQNGAGGRAATWQSGTDSKGSGSKFILQDDGNLVFYSTSGNAIWASSTEDPNADFLVMQDDGNLVLYSTTGSVLWSSKL